MSRVISNRDVFGRLIINDLPDKLLGNQGVFYDKRSHQAS